MMGDRRKVNFQGQDVWAEDVEFEPQRESWGEYILTDGTKLKMRTVVSEVLRLDIFQPNGDPIYIVNAANVMTAVVPDRLKRKG